MLVPALDFNYARTGIRLYYESNEALFGGVSLAGVVNVLMNTSTSLSNSAKATMIPATRVQFLGYVPKPDKAQRML